MQRAGLVAFHHDGEVDDTLSRIVATCQFEASTLQAQRAVQRLVVADGILARHCQRTATNDGLARML